MRKGLITAGPRVISGWVLMLALLIQLAVSGCAPKRVVNGKAEQIPSKRDKKKTAITLDIPAPEAHGKVQNETKSTPLEDLQLGLKVATMAREQLDKPYQWGAQGPEKFDCSGLVFYIFGALGISMPRVSRQQATVGAKVEKSELQPGDLVFFITSCKTINHVGIYVGSSKFIHAPRRYSPVRYDSLNDSWWRQRFKFGRRISG